MRNGEAKDPPRAKKLLSTPQGRAVLESFAPKKEKICQELFGKGLLLILVFFVGEPDEYGLDVQ
jgi:hypothetical protein